MIHLCTSEDMHPYECDGPGKCIHCDRLQRTSLMTGDILHDPATCALVIPSTTSSPILIGSRWPRE